MHLIDCHRFCIDIFGLSTLFHPFFISPFKMIYICDCRCCSRTKFRIICIWICFIKPLSIFRLDQILIQSPFLYTRNKQFKYSHRIRLKPCHFICRFIPSVKRTNHPYSCGIRSPHIKTYSTNSILIRKMSPQFPVNLVMRRLSK